MALNASQQAIEDGFEDRYQDEQEFNQMLYDVLGDDADWEFENTDKERTSKTKELKKKHKFLKNFMDKEKIKFADDSLEFYDSVLKRRGSVEYGEFESFGTKFYIVDKNGKVSDLEFEKKGEYVGDFFDEEKEEIKHIPRVETELTNTSQYIIEHSYSSDQNQSEMFVIEIPSEHKPLK